MTFYETAASSIRLPPQENRLLSLSIGDPVQFIERQKEILLNVHETATQRTALHILGEEEKKTSTIRNAILKHHWKDFGLSDALNNDAGSKWLETLSKTSSVVGKTFLLAAIAHTVSDNEVLSKRQHTHRYLLQNHRLRENILLTLKDIKQDEAQFLSFCGDSKLQLPAPVHQQYFRYFEPLNTFCNTTPILLDFNAGLNTFRKVTQTFTHAASSILFPAYALSLTGFMSPDSSQLLQNYTLRFIGTATPIHALLSFIPSNVTQGVNASVAGFSNLSSVKNVVRWTIADIRAEAIIQHKLVHAAHFFRKIKSVYLIIKDTPLEGFLEHFSKLKDFMEKPDLQSLFTLLEKPTFDSPSSFLFRRGNVLLAWKRLTDANILQQFFPAIVALAEIDAYAAIASQLQNSKDMKRSTILKVIFQPEITPSSKKRKIQLEIEEKSTPKRMRLSRKRT